MLWTTCGQLLICSYSLLSRLFQDNSTAIGVSDALRAFALCGRVPVRCASGATQTRQRSDLQNLTKNHKEQTLPLAFGAREGGWGPRRHARRRRGWRRKTVGGAQMQRAEGGGVDGGGGIEGGGARHRVQRPGALASTEGAGPVVLTQGTGTGTQGLGTSTQSAGGRGVDAVEGGRAWHRGAAGTTESKRGGEANPTPPLAFGAKEGMALAA
ncbi:hypothetical protein DFH94DRAFT_846070 [Russula ochroleuca]|uniref:Uncharacterized protein n=1 Tax=Russula ochroleuca TaxID=152965 RepID=A0A9P5JUH7_9AGAM|nr:hypothetical protein DFH94DRAFT_849190 [Russula ochroleuca]KAF8477686.1 hypothetical protein DFH94DRAFT_846070 [Russula ochroleuca]